MKKTFILLFLTGITFYSCKKMATADLPPDQLTDSRVFSDSTSVNAAIAGLFTKLGTVDANLYKNLGLYSDELKTTSATAVSVEFSNSELTVKNTSVLSVWQNLYNTIYKANSLIEGIKPVNNLPSQLKNNALGESIFVRGYCYFLLQRLFGDVPLLLNTNTSANALAANSSSNQVLDQSIADFDNAQHLLTADYPLNNGKTTANKYTATAFLSLACLENKSYERADSAATVVIQSGIYNLLSDLTQLCTENNNEAIFQLWNQNGVSTLSSVTVSGIPPYQPTGSLLASFDLGDQRKTAWIGSITVSGTTYNFPYKYRQRSPTSGSNGEYDTFMRLDEVYLIRSEAKARKNDLAGSQSDLNVIRNRAGLSALGLTKQTDLLNAILKERQIEFFAENGTRFFDLKRFELLDQVLNPIKPFWKSTNSLFPIPQTEILNNPNLKQNTGY